MLWGYGVHISLKIAEEDRFYPTLTLPVCIGERTGNLISPQYIGGIKGGDTTCVYTVDALGRGAFALLKCGVRFLFLIYARGLISSTSISHPEIPIFSYFSFVY